MNDIAQGHTNTYYNETVYDDFNSKNKTVKNKDGNDIYVVRK